jgi:hypothetical protein
LRLDRTSRAPSPPHAHSHRILVFNLDTCGSARDLTSIEMLHLAAESHGDRSIEAPTVSWALEPQHWCQRVRE